MELQYLENAIQNGGRIVVLMGRQVAVDCGCLMFRDGDDAYAIEQEYGYSPDEIFSASFYNTRMDKFFRFYKEKILSNVGEPDDCIRAIKKMEDDGKVTAVVTRSIYGLLHRAGVRNVIDFHGNIYENRCPHCGKEYSMEYVRDSKGLPRCENCGTVVRPQLTLDGEMMPNEKVTRAANELSKADTMLVLGTSMDEALTQQCITYFSGKKIILINERENFWDSRADLVYTGKPRDILPKVIFK